MKSGIRILFVLLLVLFGTMKARGQASPVIIDDFDSYGEGALPVKWRAQLNGKLVPLTEEFVDDNEWFYAKRENGKRFVRAYAKGEAVHINMENGAAFDWDLRENPMISWEWRAISLPSGAREDKEKRNDSGAGLYVMFSMEGFIIKRPKSIKYVYSSSLPEGTVVSYGSLKVIVVSSQLDGTGKWITVKRDVVADYQKVFGGKPPNKPLFIRLWSDSDDTRSEAIADFDNLMLLPQ